MDDSSIETLLSTSDAVSAASLEVRQKADSVIAKDDEEEEEEESITDSQTTKARPSIGDKTSTPDGDDEDGESSS